MTSFTEHVDGYLRLGRSFGYKRVEHECPLRQFAVTGSPILARIRPAPTT
jgi:hypothetical protein